jgi:hypothetical protein
MASDKRDCPVDGCTNKHESDKLMCRRHWYSVPRHLRDALWSAINEHGWFSNEAGLARGECIRAANLKEHAANH